MIRMLILCLLLMPWAAAADERESSSSVLDRFEAGATGDADEKKNKRKRHRGHRDDDHSYQGDDDECHTLAGCIFGALFEALFQAMAVHPGHYQDPNATTRGFYFGPEPWMLPYLALDTSALLFADGVSGQDVRFEGGSGLLGFEIQDSQFYTATDTMAIGQFGFKVRIPAGPRATVAPTFGGVVLNGNSAHGGWYVGVPISFRLHRHLWGEARVASADFSAGSYIDMEAALVYGFRLVGVRASYRALMTGGATLHGPTLGLSARLW